MVLGTHNSLSGMYTHYINMCTDRRGDANVPRSISTDPAKCDPFAVSKDTGRATIAGGKHWPYWRRDRDKRVRSWVTGTMDKPCTCRRIQAREKPLVGSDYFDY